MTARYGLGQAFQRALVSRAALEPALAAALRRADVFDATEADVWRVVQELLAIGETDLATEAAAQVLEERDTRGKP